METSVSLGVFRLFYPSLQCLSPQDIFYFTNVKFGTFVIAVAMETGVEVENMHISRHFLSWLPWQPESNGIGILRITRKSSLGILS